jgi:hypothetical protein
MWESRHKSLNAALRDSRIEADERDLAPEQRERKVDGWGHR